MYRPATVLVSGLFISGSNRFLLFVSLEELVFSQSYEMVALITVPEREGILTREEIISVIKELRGLGDCRKAGAAADQHLKLSNSGHVDLPCRSDGPGLFRRLWRGGRRLPHNLHRSGRSGTRGDPGALPDHSGRMEALQGLGGAEADDRGAPCQTGTEPVRLYSCPCSGRSRLGRHPIDTGGR